MNGAWQRLYLYCPLLLLLLGRLKNVHLTKSLHGREASVGFHPSVLSLGPLHLQPSPLERQGDLLLRSKVMFSYLSRLTPPTLFGGGDLSWEIVQGTAFKINDKFEVASKIGQAQMFVFTSLLEVVYVYSMSCPELGMW